MKNKFLSISVGVSLILLSAGFLIHCIDSANAGTLPKPEKFFDQGSNQIGRYMMNYVIVPAYNGNQPSYTVMVWDTETGKSLSYTYSNVQQKWVKDAANTQLPANPLQ